MSSDHFSVDGTLIESWASLKSFRPKDDDDDDNNKWGDFRGKKRSNETHESKTDPEAKLARKSNGKEAKLAYAGHALMENRNGLIVDLCVTQANGFAERRAALAMIDNSLVGAKRITLAADRGYDAREFVADLRSRNVTPHVAPTGCKRDASEHRTLERVGYAISQRVRRRIESIFGWMQSTAGLRRSRVRGLQRTQLAAHLVAAAYNLLRIAKLTAATT